MKIKLLMLIVLVFITSCEVFTIKGKKIVEEASATYTQTTPIGTVKIFITELQNENYLAAVDLMLKENGSILTATEKYETTNDLARLKRYIDGKALKKENADENIITLEYANGSKAVFYTIEKEKLFYITSYKRE